MELQLQAIVTLLTLVNPAMCAATFLRCNLPAGRGVAAAPSAAGRRSQVWIDVAGYPGACGITGLITLAVSHSKLEIPVTALVAVGVAVGTMWLVLLLAILLSSRRESDGNGGGQNGGFVRDTIMGLIVIAMGVQFALTGIKAFMSS